MDNKESEKFILESGEEKENISLERIPEVIYDRINKLGNEYKYPKNFFSEQFSNDYNALYRDCLGDFENEDKLLEILFEAKRFIETEENLDKQRNKKLEKREIREIFLNLTDWQLKLTKLFLEKGKNKEFCTTFWRKLESFYKLFSSKQSIEERGAAVDKIRRGIVGQVGVFQLLKKLGLSPQLATPEEDAFKKTDLWCKFPGEEKKEIPIQVKYTTRVGELLIMKSNEATYPSIGLKGKNIRISSKDAREIARLKEKNREGIYIALPRGAVDADTGEIHQSFLEEYGAEIKRYFE